MNWCMVAICGLCIPLLLVFKEKYHRSELDVAKIQKERGPTRHRRTQVTDDEGEDEKAHLLSRSHEDSLKRNYTSSGNSVV